MDAITALQQRVSVSRLTTPAPTQEQRNLLISAALRAADHGNLKPWRFIGIEGDGLDRLGELFERVASTKESLNDAQRERFRNMPKRAPLIITVVAKCQEHIKIPLNEQLLSSAAAAQNLITAAYALGLGAIWRTGDLAYDAEIKHALGLVGLEQIIGFIYLGTPVAQVSPAKEVNPGDFFTVWPE